MVPGQGVQLLPALPLRDAVGYPPANRSIPFVCRFFLPAAEHPLVRVAAQPRSHRQSQTRIAVPALAPSRSCNMPLAPRPFRLHGVIRVPRAGAPHPFRSPAPLPRARPVWSSFDKVYGNMERGDREYQQSQHQRSHRRYPPARSGPYVRGTARLTLDCNPHDTAHSFPRPAQASTATS